MTKGLLASIYTNLNQTTAKDLLCGGADDRVGDTNDVTGFDNYYGWGRLNAFNSLMLARLRIDRIFVTNDLLSFHWQSPPNASLRTPYRVEYAAEAVGPWKFLQFQYDSNSFQYQTNLTVWTYTFPAATNADITSRFYRVRIRQF